MDNEIEFIVGEGPERQTEIGGKAVCMGDERPRPSTCLLRGVFVSPSRQVYMTEWGTGISRLFAEVNQRIASGP